MVLAEDILLDDVVAPHFYDLHIDIKEDLYSEYWLKGGRGSTKSTFISLEILLGILQDEQANAIVFRRYQNELRDTVFGQFQWSATKLGIDHYFNFQVSPMQIVYIPTGQKIVFKSADNPRKIKSVNLGSGYIKYAWFEEVDQFGGMDEIRNIIQSLFRGENHKRISFYSFNPPKSNKSWVNQETKLLKPNRKVHHSTYLTVPRSWLGDLFIHEAEHLKNVNENAYKHEYLGEEVGTGLEVFNNVVVREITDEEIAYYDQVRQGLDFGYAVDPLAFERFHYDRKKRRVYVFDEISGINLFNREFYERAVSYARNMTIADSAEPKSIAELKGMGMKIKGAYKGQGSVEHGVKFLQDMEQIVIDPNRAPRASKEFMNYSLEVDRQGEVKSRFPDIDNHTIDAIRYGLNDDMTIKRAKGSDIRRKLGI